MEKLPWHPPVQLRRPLPCFTANPTFPAHSVYLVSHDGVTNVLQVDPNLMGSTRPQCNLQQLSTEPALQNPEARSRMAPILHDRHALAFPFRTHNGSIDLQL